MIFISNWKETSELHPNIYKRLLFWGKKHNYPGSLARTATKMAIQPAGREENCRTYR